MARDSAHAGFTAQMSLPNYNFPARFLGPLTLGGTSVTMRLQIDDADAVIRRAAEAGAEIESEPEDQFYGERSGWLRYPSGHRWNVGHFLADVTPEEMQRRFTAMMTGTGS